MWWTTYIIKTTLKDQVKKFSALTDRWNYSESSDTLQGL